MTPKMTQTLCLLVGAHFRPPAKAILAHLPVGTELTLEREPDNPYDPNAVKVLVSASAIPQGQYASLREAVEGYGFTLEDILGAEAPWHLGYIAANPPKAAPPGITLAKDLTAWGRATLDFAPTGLPLIRISQ